MLAETETTKTPSMRLVEHLFERPLEDLLREWYEEGLSLDGMARRISQQGFEISGVSVGAWIRSLRGQRTLIFPGNPTPCQK